MKTFTGIDIIEKIIEFKLMTPDERLWDEKNLKNEPRLIRLKRINSLISAFFPKPYKSNLERFIKFFSAKHALTIQDILSGQFIALFTPADYEQCRTLMTNYLKAQDMKFSEDDSRLLDDLAFEFPAFISYKIGLYQLLSTNSGRFNTELPRVPTSFTICLTETINKGIADKYKDLDQIIESIVNPKQLRFTEVELIQKYKYPTQDLEKVDIDNW